MAHALSPRNDAYRRAEAHASAFVARRDRSAAVRYRLLTLSGDLFVDEVGDASIGLPLAVAALAAINGRRLRNLSYRCAMTGVVGSDGELGPVDPAGLRAKVDAASQAGVKRVLVPVGQAATLSGAGGVRAREVATVSQALRAALVVRRRVRIAAALPVLVGILVAGAIRLEGDCRPPSGTPNFGSIPRRRRGAEASSLAIRAKRCASPVQPASSTMREPRCAARSSRHVSRRASATCRICPRPPRRSRGMTRRPSHSPRLPS